MEYFILEDGTPMPDDGGTGFEISTSYTKGGADYFNGGTIRRGYYLRITRLTRTKTKHGYMTQTMMFTGGLKHLLLEVKRASPKAQALADTLATPELIAKVLTAVKQRCPAPH